MSKKHQIGYSLSLWETLKEYNEETKWFEPTKNKKVEVAQMLSDELSDDEEVKSLLIDKLFGYKDNIKEMIMKSDYCEIPSYHKESLEKDQKIADLEAKLAESEKDRLMWQEMYKSADKQNKEICETDIYPLQEENLKLKQQLAEKEKEKEIEELKNIHIYDKTIEIFSKGLAQKNQDKISFAVEALEIAQKYVQQYVNNFDDMNDCLCAIDNQIKQLKEMPNEK